MNRRLIIIILFSFALLTTPASGDIAAGFRAYEKGDYATAFKEWKPLAEQGDSDAQFLLGFMYENGKGVPQDFGNAVKWYRIAAENGAATAQVNLGLIYRRGRSVRQDYGEAVKWFRLAAEQDEAKGQGNLGEMYARSQGLPQDYVQAYMWFSLAASRGDEASATNREVAAKRMTPTQIAEAERLVREWKPGHPPTATDVNKEGSLEWKRGIVVDTNADRVYTGSTTSQYPDPAGPRTSTARYATIYTVVIEGEDKLYVTEQYPRWIWSKAAVPDVNQEIEYAVGKNKLCFRKAKGGKESCAYIVKTIRKKP